MTTQQVLLTTWHRHPSVLIGCTLLIVAYAAAVRWRWTPRAPYFCAGVLVLLFALLSPLHELGDRYLFSAHMLQHLLLLLIVPPLLLLGLPQHTIEATLQQPLIHAIERVLGQPLVAWMIGNGAMWLWHLPALYNAALLQEIVHITEHLFFLVSAVIFWWPLIVPGTHARLHPLAALVYLFTTMLASGILGMLLTFARPGLYPAYLRPAATPGIVRLLHENWGLTPPVDQQVGGLLMWVAGSFVYLVAIIAVLARWYGTPNDDLDPALDRDQATLQSAQRRPPDVA